MNAVWFNPDEQRAVEDFIAKLDGAWPSNTAISQIVLEVLRDSDMSARIKAAMDRQRGGQKGVRAYILREARGQAQCKLCEKFIPKADFPRHVRHEHSEDMQADNFQLATPLAASLR